MTRTRVALLFVIVGSAPLTAHADDASLNSEQPDRSATCWEESETVGHRQCLRYGIWGAAREGPYMFAEVGLRLRRLPRTGVPTRGVAAQPLTARTSTEPTAPADTGSDSSLEYVERLSVELSRPIYLGIEAEIGVSDHSETDPTARQVRAGAVGLGGLRFGAGPFVIGGEIAAGGRIVESALGERIYGAPVLETRVLAEIWLSPWVTIGGVIGTSLLEKGDRMMGFYFGVHTYSYGGQK